MAKRLGEMLAVLGWLLGALVVWAGFASQADNPRITTGLIIGIAAVPVIIGHMCYYVLAGK